jgi:hypothetical protein
MKMKSLKDTSSNPLADFSGKLGAGLKEKNMEKKAVSDLTTYFSGDLKKV